MLVSRLKFGSVLFFLSVFSFPTLGQDHAKALPKGAIERLGTAQWRHGDRILCLSFSPSGRYLAAGGGAGPVRLWDTDTGEDARFCTDTWVTGFAWSSRNSVLVTAGLNKTIRFWPVATTKDKDSKECIEDGQPLKSHTAGVKAMAMAPDGTMFASGGQDGSLLLWEFGTRKVIAKFEGHTDEILALAFSPDSNFLASAGGDRTIRIWDADKTKFLRTFDGLCAVSAVVFVNEKTLATGGDDNKIRLWDVDSGKILETLSGHDGTVASLLLSKDGKTLISGGHDKTIRLWDIAKRVEIAKLERGLGDADALALTRDGKTLASAGFNNTIRRWDVESRKELPTIGHQSPVTSLAVAPNGKLIASGTSTGEIRVWDPIAAKEIKQWQAHTWKGPLTADMIMAFGPDNQTLASVIETDAVRLWNATTGKQEKQFGEPGDVPALSLAFSPEGKYLAVGYRNDIIRIWDVAEGKAVHNQIKYLDKPNGKVQALAFSHDGKTLAASGSSSIVLINPADGKVIRTFGPKEGALPPDVTAIAFSPNGKIVATGAGATIHLYDADTGKELRALEGHQNLVYSLAFSADGRNLASASADQNVHLWETVSGQLIKAWKGHRGAARAVALLPTGRIVVSGGEDTSLLFWDVTGRSPSGKLTPWTPPAGDMQTAWLDLAALDPAPANRALWDFVAGGKEGVAFFEKNVPLVDRKKITQYIKDLDDDSFNVRNTANLELAKFGRLVENTLKKELEKSPSVEMTRRIRGLLDKLPGGLTGEQINLRYRRVMTALEQEAGPEARALLTKLIDGAPTEEGINLEAEAALTRLKKRGQ